MGMASCTCCEDNGSKNCPTFRFIRLSKWVGDRVIPNDLREINLHQFKLRLTFLGSTEETGWLSPRSTIGQIQAALAALANVGPSPTVTSEGGLPGPTGLPDTLWVYFDTPLTTGQDVPLLEYINSPNSLDPASFSIGIVREGGPGVDEIQSITRNPGVYDLANLGEFENSVWQWRVVVVGSSTFVRDSMKLCIQQNRREWAAWITPFSDRPVSRYYTVSFGGIKFIDAPLSGAVVGGTFDFNLTVGSALDTATLNHNVNDAVMLAAIQSLSNTANAGTIGTNGGSLPTDPISASFADPIESVSVSVQSNLIGSSPTITQETIHDGDATAGEWQRLSYDWPATSGSFTITAFNAAGTISQTTGPIPYNATHRDVASALAALSVLSGVPVATVATVANGGPGVNELQTISISNGVTVTGGTFTITLTVNGSTATTTLIPVTGGASAVYSALRSLPNVLGTDEFSVTADESLGLMFPVSIRFTGTLGQQNIPQLVYSGSLTGVNVLVTSTGYSTVNQVKFDIKFVGALSGIDMPDLIPASSLACKPTVILDSVQNSDANQFRNTYEPLNVGTTWKHYLRDAYGKPSNRSLKIDWVYNQLPTMLARDLVFDNAIQAYVPGPLFRIDRECGEGEWGPDAVDHPVQCGIRSWYLEGFPDWPEGLLPITPRRHLTSQFHEFYAEFNSLNGTINVFAATNELELAFEVRCLGCRYSSEFNLFGSNEQAINGYFSALSWREGTLHDGNLSGNLEACGVNPPGCRDWRLYYDNVPHIARTVIGLDGFDAHVINKRFYAPDGIDTRKPPCTVQVVSMGNGYYLEEHRSPVLGKITQGPRGGCVIGCRPKPKREQVVENSVIDIDQLKITFSNNYSHWGDWIDMEYSIVPGNLIRCRFNEFDLSDVKVLILGGLPCEPVGDSETRRAAINHGHPSELLLKDYEQGVATYRSLFFGNQVYDGLVHKEFEPDTLSTLQNWLSTGGKVLLIDGGLIPSKFYSSLGCTTTVEPQADAMQDGDSITENTLNGSLKHGTLNPGNLNQQGVWYSGNPVWGPMPVYEARPEFAGFNPVMNSLPHPFTTDVGQLAYASRKNIPVINMGGFNPAVRENLMRPSGGLTTYTLCIPKVTPGPNAVPIAQVSGRIASNGGVVPPWYGFPAGPFYTADLGNYVGMAVEHWNGFFKLRFTYGGTPHETNAIPFNASAALIKSELEALPNVGGPSLTVIGGPLPGSIDVYFDNTSLAGTDVPLLEIVDSVNITVKLVREGGSGVDEIQRLSKGVGPSRIIISGITELVDPDGFGTDFRDPEAFGATGQNSLDEENDANFYTVSREGDCIIHKIPEYCLSEYVWGLGLTHIVPSQFLRNLLEKADEY